jgi:hypothetical protein
MTNFVQTTNKLIKKMSETRISDNDQHNQLKALDSVSFITFFYLFIDYNINIFIISSRPLPIFGFVSQNPIEKNEKYLYS